MIGGGNIDWVKAQVSQDTGICKAYIHEKEANAPISKSRDPLSPIVLDRVHRDVFEKLLVPSLGRFLYFYFMSFTNDHSRYCGIYAIKSKADAFSTFRKWLSMIEMQTGRKLKDFIRMVVVSTYSLSWKLSNPSVGTVPLLIVSEHPQRNGIAKRFNWTLLLARLILYPMNLGTEYCAATLNVAVHVRNGVTTQGIPELTISHEAMLGQKPDVNHLWVLGSRCWDKVGKESRSKPCRQLRDAVWMG